MGLKCVPPYRLEKAITRQVARDCMVTFGGNRYSVPFGFAGQKVQIELWGDEIRLMCGSWGLSIANVRMRKVMGITFEDLKKLTPDELCLVVSAVQTSELAINNGECSASYAHARGILVGMRWRPTKMYRGDASCCPEWLPR